MPTIKVLPRDIQPGDKMERLNQDLEIVLEPVSRIIPNKIKGTTRSYKVYFVGRDLLPEHQRTWPEHSHLRPITLRPHLRVKVERKEA